MIKGDYKFLFFNSTGLKTNIENNKNYVILQKMLYVNVIVNVIVLWKKWKNMPILNPPFLELCKYIFIIFNFQNQGDDCEQNDNELPASARQLPALETDSFPDENSGKMYYLRNQRTETWLTRMSQHDVVRPLFWGSEVFS